MLHEGGQTDSPTTSGTPASQLLQLLNIPSSLTVRDKSGDVQLAWKKYNAINQVSEGLKQLIKDGVWTGKKPKQEELIELFVSKSVWHTTYKVLFCRVEHFKEVRKWLDGDADAPSKSDLFGKVRMQYNFKDLADVLDVLEKKKKEKEEEGKKEKEKEKEKEKKKEGKKGDKGKQHTM
jgi:hypothetical protein